MNLKQKTVSGLIWSFADNVAGQGITFIVGIALARILSPKEFGLIGMLAIFIAISQSFVDSGFSLALIRKQNCTEIDYSTIFYFNISIAVFLYGILFLLSNNIGDYFHEPILKKLLRVIGLSLIFNSTSIIHNTLLVKRIDFKLQAKISLFASFLSGLISIYMAYSGWGVWSLVALTLVKNVLNSTCLWIFNKWRPLLCFSYRSFKELFSFGSKLLTSGLIETVYRNIYYLIIGKYFSVIELGYYTRADQFQSLPSSNLQGIIGRVSYPVLSSLQDDIPRLRGAYKKIIRSSMLITFILMLGLVAVSKPLILSLIGEKWEQSIIYLQLLCFVGMFYPLHALNLNILQVQGRSDLFLKLEILKKLIAIPVIVIAIFFGIKAMIFGMIILSVVAFFLNSYYSGHFIGYSSLEQIKDIIPSFLVAFAISSLVYCETLIFDFMPIYLLVIQIFSGLLFFFFLCEAINFQDYTYVKEIVKDKIKSKRNS